MEMTYVVRHVWAYLGLTTQRTPGRSRMILAQLVGKAIVWTECCQFATIGLEVLSVYYVLPNHVAAGAVAAFVDLSEISQSLCGTVCQTTGTWALFLRRSSNMGTDKTDDEL